MKKYKYDSKRYLLSVTIPGFFMILILIYALFNNYTNFNLNIYSLLIIVCTYGIFNTFISSSNPKKIIIDSKCIHFTSFMTTHKYEIKGIEKIRIREFYNKKIYLKINDGNLFKGRYWIRTNMFNNSIELYSYFIELEECLYPDSLKFRNKKFENKNI
ncbi:TPA: hypothetical protein KNO10_003450 [Clostridioides difficile]|uniref:hypothetical protein n=1 Tax=Clostridioides difficile TaxID=1496 RepID=UPI0009801182|nr:hypothetical protein [Clostridioides difficile]SJR55211.1 Uncharacterised protein [Clostridioides difficile]HBF0730251.1 hypothetical protein [Clostridioides difficile]HBF6041572.1 hypothetical protein [Clostridioides difficile]HBF7389615.1 hypothetical protein [Clostridioides difficile]HBG3351490.1 hypothetical protein [Clostridioides difficile]